jgi:hypothetical protein
MSLVLDAKRPTAIRSARLPNPWKILALLALLLALPGCRRAKVEPL